MEAASAPSYTPHRLLCASLTHLGARIDPKAFSLPIRPVLLLAFFFFWHLVVWRQPQVIVRPVLLVVLLLRFFCAWPLLCGHFVELAFDQPYSFSHRFPLRDFLWSPNTVRFFSFRIPFVADEGIFVIFGSGFNFALCSSANTLPKCLQLFPQPREPKSVPFFFS